MSTATVRARVGLFAAGCGARNAKVPIRQLRSIAFQERKREHPNFGKGNSETRVRIASVRWAIDRDREVLAVDGVNVRKGLDCPSMKSGQQAKLGIPVVDAGERVDFSPFPPGIVECANTERERLGVQSANCRGGTK